MGFHFFASLVERCLRLLTNNVKLVKVPDINYSQQIMCTNVRLLSESTADELVLHSRDLDAIYLDCC